MNMSLKMVWYRASEAGHHGCSKNQWVMDIYLKMIPAIDEIEASRNCFKLKLTIFLKLLSIANTPQCTHNNIMNRVVLSASQSLNKQRSVSPSSDKWCIHSWKRLITDATERELCIDSYTDSSVREHATSWAVHIYSQNCNQSNGHTLHILQPCSQEVEIVLVFCFYSWLSYCTH